MPRHQEPSRTRRRHPALLWQGRSQAIAALAELGAVRHVLGVAKLPLPPAEALEQLLTRVVHVLGGDKAQVVRIPEPQAALPPDAPAAVQIAVRRRQSLIVDDASRLPGDAGWAADESVGSLAVTPLVVSGGVVGGLLVTSRHLRRFDEADRVLLEVVADRVALEVERCRLVEERAEAAAASDASQERADAVITASADGILLVDRSGIIRLANPTVERMFGYPPGSLAGTDVNRLTPLDVQQRHAVLVANTVMERMPTVIGHTRDVLGRRRDGTVVPMEVTLTTVPTPDGGQFCAVVRDVSARRALENQLTFQSLHDPLTGLGNRTLLDDRLHQALARLERRPGTLALLLLDLDHFKTINDTLGHSAGDRLLIEIAHRLQSAVRPEDTVVRLGGDEFVVVCEQLPDAAAMTHLAHRVLEAVRAPVELRGGGRHQPTTTIGATLTTRPVDAEELLAEADLALYAAKDAGRDRTAVFEPAMREQAVGRMRLRSQLHAAIRSGEIDVLYQPQFDLDSATVVGAEALVRWRHPEHGLLTPATFLPLAADTDLIIDLDAHVVTRACRDISEASRAVGRDLEAWINISSRTLGAGGLRDLVSAACRSSGLPARSVTVELTEGALGQDLPTTVDVVGALRRDGVRVAVDDFGTGYSSLNFLTNLPINAVKLDGSLLDGEHAPAIVRSLSDLGQALHLVTVAEGVETREQLAAVSAGGCQRGQGFGLARPMPVRDLINCALQPVRLT